MPLLTLASRLLVRLLLNPSTLNLNSSSNISNKIDQLVVALISTCSLPQVPLKTKLPQSFLDDNQLHNLSRNQPMHFLLISWLQVQMHRNLSPILWTF
jgi:hypothetical protein